MQKKNNDNNEIEFSSKIINNSLKDCNEKKKFTYRSDFSFIPQIELIHNEVKEITKDLIDDLLIKIRHIIQRKRC